jgi:hypothetical protein
MDDRSGFPWLTASKLPDLVRFAPQRREDGVQSDLPTHIRLPDGEEMPVSASCDESRRITLSFFVHLLLEFRSSAHQYAQLSETARCVAWM